MSLAQVAHPILPRRADINSGIEGYQPNRHMPGFPALVVQSLDEELRGVSDDVDPAVFLEKHTFSIDAAGHRAGHVNGQHQVDGGHNALGTA